MKTRETKYGSWNIRYEVEPKTESNYRAIATHQRSLKLDSVHAIGTSTEDAIQRVRQMIDEMKGMKTLSQERTTVTVDFNVDFDIDIIGGIENAHVAFVKHFEKILLLVASERFLGSVALHDRRQEKENGHRLLATTISLRQANELGLTNSRYTLEETDPHNGQLTYLVKYNSDIFEGEKIRLNTPGFGVS